MLEKANDQDLEGLSAYTIRNLDSKIVTGSDISQYKLMNVKEAPINNRQEHLDLLCFPTLFPTGQYGEHHPRQSYPAQTLSFSKYITFKRRFPISQKSFKLPALLRTKN